MISVAKLDDVIKNMGKRTGYELIGEKDGCVNGCRCGVSVYTREEYDLTHAGAHDDQEGFFVLEGRGRAMVGDDEIVLEPGRRGFGAGAHSETSEREGEVGDAR